MAFPFARAVPMLRGLSELTTLAQPSANGAHLMAWLATHSDAMSLVEFTNAVRLLAEDEFVVADFDPDDGDEPGANIEIALGRRGRQLVDGWPSSGSVDAEALASAIITALDAQGAEHDAPDELKSLAKRLAEGALSTAFSTAVAAGMTTAGF